jgi:hypothetical protein
VATSQEISQAVDLSRRLNPTDSGAQLVPQTTLPVVSGLRVAAQTAVFGAVNVTLSWLAPDDPLGQIATYRVYATNVVATNAVPLLLAEVTDAPAQVQTTTDATNIVVFLVQITFRNGQANDFALCPTTTATVAAPVVDMTVPDGSITLSKFASGIAPVSYGVGLPSMPNVAYPSGTTYLNLTDGKLYRSTGSAWVKTVDGADIVANSITAGKFAAGAIVAGDIAAAQIDATKINLKTIIINGLTLTSNSPGLGQIAWSNFTIFYNGGTYAIGSGNTSNKFITWPAGTTSLTTGNTYAPAIGLFLIATNTLGTADEAWNKGGTAASALQKTNLSFYLLEGFQPQPLIGANLSATAGTSTGSAVVLAYSGTGVLLSYGIYQVSGTTSCPVGQTTDCFIDISIDGSTTQSMRFISVASSGGANPDGDAAALGSVEGSFSGGTGSVSLQQPVSFLSSCIVTVRYATSGGGAVGGTGVIRGVAQWAIKT